MSEFVEVLCRDLISRKGEDDFRQWKNRPAEIEQPFIGAWTRLFRLGMADQLPDLVTRLLGILNNSIVDADFPACPAGTVMNNSFAQVKLLSSLAEFMGVEHFFPTLLQYAPHNRIFWAAYARYLLKNGQYIRASDAAVRASALDAFDYCCRRVLNDTQRSLAEHGLPAKYLPRTVRENAFCSAPFLECVYIPGRNSIAACTCCLCMDWAGIAVEGDLSFNSADLQDFRASILDGSFKYCDEQRCRHLLTDSLPSRDTVSDPYLQHILEHQTTQCSRGPESLTLAYDYVCNLSCPSCRGSVFSASAETVKAYDELFDNHIMPMLPHVKVLKLSGAGEALVSAHSRRILKNVTQETYPDVSITLMSNCSTIGPQIWKRLGNTAASIRKLHISIDGGTPDTLEALRRGLRWPRMLEALDFIRSLRTAGKVENVVVTCVLQTANYREMAEILQLCCVYRIDQTNFGMLGSHGSYTHEEFAAINVCDPSHPLFSDLLGKIVEVREIHAAKRKNGEYVPCMHIAPFLDPYLRAEEERKA
jgi:molybdenum cofactor biosynthesis enzyme MoaA